MCVGVSSHHNSNYQKALTEFRVYITQNLIRPLELQSVRMSPSRIT